MVPGEYEVVISGIGGKFPECQSVEEFKQKLLAKENLLKSDIQRWTPRRGQEKPFTSGKIPDWDKFDSSFFGVHSRLVRNADPMMGLMLERTYEAIVDAGVNPYSLKGRKVCVISSTSFSDCEAMNITTDAHLEGLGMVGHSRAMMANRISYCFNFTGPSYSLDSTWTSALQALEIAARMVSRGGVESAIVATCNLIAHNSIDYEYNCMNLLAPDGKCSPFDVEATGFARSEGTSCIFIQRAKDAKRNYCTVLKTQVRYIGERECSYIRMDSHIEDFFKNFYKNCIVAPHLVSYLETNVSCLKDYDKEELNAVANVFCDKRTSPLLIGSMSGNIGNSEAPSGLMSLTKAIIAMEGGVIPPTINYNTPNPDVPALVKGQLKPVTESTELTGNIVGVNSVTMYGTVAHTLLKRHNKTKKSLSVGELPADGIPRLVVLQARNEDGARAIIDKVTAMPVDVEWVSLVNGVFKTPVPANLWRAYTVVPSTSTTPAQNAQLFNMAKRPLWYVFSGMGSQWNGMGRDLLKVPVFANAIDTCDRVLRPRGVDITNIITTTDPTTFDNILNSFVGITAIQIGLVDILRTLGLTPDGMIGHSMGELGCAYADGCLSAEETILGAYARGQASQEALQECPEAIQGMMAAVGMGYQEIKDQLPSAIDVACHNAFNSCTLSGPTEDVYKFVDELKSSGVFAKAVSAGGIAYHSRYMKKIAPKLLKYLKETIPNPKPRSSRWISSSAPKTQWETTDAKLCSAEYHTNNLLNPVLFEEACKYLPNNAVLVEIAPRGLLQAILVRSISSDILNLSLTNNSAGCNVTHLLGTVGKLYLNNIDVDVNKLYPPIHFPVSRGTPNLSDLVVWDHTDVLYIRFSANVSMILRKGTMENIEHIDESNPDYQLWKEYVVDDSVVVPFTQLLVYAWKNVILSKRLEFDQHPIAIEEVTIVDNIIAQERGNTVLVTLTPATFKFEVSENSVIKNKKDVILLSGKLFETAASVSEVPEIPKDVYDFEEVTDKEIYTMFSHHGRKLGPQFQLIKQILIGNKECFAKVEWTGSFVTFLDAVFKIVVFILSDKQQELLKPTFFNRFTIDVPLLSKLPTGSVVEVYYNIHCNHLVCKGLELFGLTLTPDRSEISSCLKWEEVKLQPYLDSRLTLKQFMSASIQVVSDTGLTSWSDKASQLIILVVKDDPLPPSMFTPLLRGAFQDQPKVSFKLLETDVSKAKDQLALLGTQVYLVAGECNTVLSLMDSSTFPDNVYCLTPLSNNGLIKISKTLRPIMMYQSDAGKLVLLKKVGSLDKSIVFEAKGCDWLEKMRHLINNNNNNELPVIVFSHCLTPRQVLPTFANESFVHRLRFVFILDRNAPQFSLTSPVYSSQLSLGLPINILSTGVWNSLQRVDLNHAPLKKNLDCFIKSTQQSLDIYCVGLNTTRLTHNKISSVDELELQYIDYSGRLSGQRVMGFAHLDPISHKVTSDPILTWTMPDDWNMVDAATVPIAYTLAYYCMHLKAKVEAGEDVLVHVGMSPVGLAAIGFALEARANVIVSVMSDEEAKLLPKAFPSLKPDHVFVLGDQDIKVVVSKLTAGKGVEVVLCCVQGRDMQSSVNVMAFDCRFLHLSDIKVEAKEFIGMYSFFRRTSFLGVSLDSIVHCSNEEKLEIKEAVQRGITNGLVKPFKRTSFSLKNHSEAFQNLLEKNSVEKSVLVAKKEGQLHLSTDSLQYNRNELVIIAGTKMEFWLDVAEWLVRHGARKLIVLSDEEELVGSHVRRFNKLINLRKSTIVVTSLRRIDSEESAVLFLEEMLHMGPIYSIFCIKMDESNDMLKSLDTASRLLLPQLRQFVCLLGESTAVCESRATAGLPAISVQSDSPIQTPAQLIPYFFNILTEDSCHGRFFIVSDKVSTINKSEILDYQYFLPSSVEELHRLGLKVSDRLSFQEETSRSPRYQHVQHSLLPVFVVPGLVVDSVQPLLRQLIHPTFCSSLPSSVQTIKQSAECLLKSLLQIQKQGPYNLVGDSWNGAVALTLGCLLEDAGHQVELFWLDGSPIAAQERIKALCERYGADLGSSLLTSLLTLPMEVRVTTSPLNRPWLASNWRPPVQCTEH